MSNYTPTIGLEIHAQLKTETKMFCNSKNDPDETRPNVNVCPICMGHPGTLPTLNKEAIRHVLKVGVAVGGELADFTEWDRKNYFYPDIPKGYQISQYKYPLVKVGELAGVKLTRIHLEEDTALSKHKDDHSLVDFNRAGVPLMELVTEPDMHSAEEAVAFAKEFQLLLRYLDASEANMEKGEFRIEANISVASMRADERGTNAESRGKNKRESVNLGTKVEVKNLNSFRSVARAIEHEVKRQIEVLESGSEIVQETRGWDDAKQVSFSQRTKETSEDYRYFPEPDLPKLKISEIPEFAEDKLKAALPELPRQRRERYLKLGLKEEDVDMFVANMPFGRFFDTVNEILDDDEKSKLAANYIAADLAGLAEGRAFEIDPKHFVELIEMVAADELSSRGAKDVLKIMHDEGGDPREIAEREGLLQKSNEAELKKIAKAIIVDNPKVAKEYRAGKKEVLQFFVGQAMKETKGAANPQILQKLFKAELDRR